MGVYAQETPVNGVNLDKVDSLTQVVNDLSSHVKKVEDDKRNESIWKKRSKYFQIGYMNQTLTNQDIPDLKWKSDFGVSKEGSLFGRVVQLISFCTTEPKIFKISSSVEKSLFSNIITIINYAPCQNKVCFFT